MTGTADDVDEAEDVPQDGRADGWPHDACHPRWTRRPAITAMRALLDQAGRYEPDMSVVREALSALYGWREAGYPGVSRSTVAGSRDRVGPPDPPQVRAWARRSGLPVATRGRVPEAIIDLYLAGHGTTTAGEEEPRSHGDRDAATREG